MLTSLDGVSEEIVIINIKQNYLLCDVMNGSIYDVNTHLVEKQLIYDVNTHLVQKHRLLQNPKSNFRNGHEI